MAWATLVFIMFRSNYKNNIWDVFEVYCSNSVGLVHPTSALGTFLLTAVNLLKNSPG
jgi:hypothetical protein